MQRILLYLQNVEPIHVAAVLFAGVLLFVFTPSRWRMGVSLALLAFWLSANRFSHFPILISVLKVGIAVPMFLVCVTAFFHPGPKRGVAPIVFAYPIMGLVGMLFVFWAEDRTIALVYQFAFALMSLAAILVVRTVHDDRSLRYVLWWTVSGLAGTLLIMLYALVGSGTSSFIAGIHRFAPFGARPNVYGTSVALAVVLCTYLAFTNRNLLLRIPLSFLAAVGMGIIVIGGSRTAAYAVAAALIPSAFYMIRRPLGAVVIGLVLLTAGGWFLGFAPDESLSRITSTDLSNRDLIFAQYLESIEESPIVGLFGSSGKLAFIDPEIGTHSHNAYLQLLFVGGFVYAVPWFLLIIYSLYCGFMVLLRRKRIDIDNYFLFTACALLGAIYLHGLGVPVTYQPTDIWAFYHVFLACLLMTLAKASKEAVLVPQHALNPGIAAWRPPRRLTQG